MALSLIDAGGAVAVPNSSPHALWQDMPELPGSGEIMATSDPEGLPHNPVDQPWDCQEDYLEAQYKILRCEGTEGLRFSVESYRKAQTERREMWDDDHTWVYPDVRVKGYLMAKIGAVVRVEFSTSRSRFIINWLQSKRLMPGKLVALTTKADGFKTICKVATIAQRPYRDGLDQDPPLVDLLWADEADAVFDPAEEMVMVESRHGYFEASRHALAGLQDISNNGSPLMKYLMGVYTTETPAEFVRESSVMDLSPLAHLASVPASQIKLLRTYNILENGMPPLGDSVTTLDASQVQALERILSQELAIIQGPPGTGKTFTSVEAIKVMAATRRKFGGPPLIVASQTNHALDSLLSRCVAAGVKVIRIGGRASTEEMQERSIYSARLRRPGRPTDAYKSNESARRKGVDSIQCLVDRIFGDRLLDPGILRETGVITEAQYQSLFDSSMEMDPSFQRLGVFSLWLGESLIPARILRDRYTANPQQVDPLLEEFEIEGDLQHIAEDEEENDRIKGHFIPLSHVWSGKEPTHLTSWHNVARRELANSQDLFAIRPELRGAVYQLLQSKLLKEAQPRFVEHLRQYTLFCKTSKDLRQKRDVFVVEGEMADAVGCTTTGLTKYRAFLSKLRPRSLLIEEAAETREANIVSALYPSVKQLILIGDHQQLAPSCDIRWLGPSPYNLNTSLFQRMVNLGVPFTMLNVQRRMKRELRTILGPFYPDLTDHPLVLSQTNRPDVPGMGGRNCWFFDHTWLEDTNSDHSKYNEQEAQMVTGFFAYLVANGMPSERITVLTFYTGQRKLISAMLRRHGSLIGCTFRVCTVDSYQGEENDVVLLSLVRSPHPDYGPRVGFLEDRRRAVVAISRARRGLYIFGNVENILRAGVQSFEIWGRIWDGFAQQGMVDRQRGFPLVCQNHSRITHIRDVSDWGDNAGGCNMKCDKTRSCGHKCTLKCHASPHELLTCSQPCLLVLLCGHGCQRYCGQECFCDCKTFAANNGLITEYDLEEEPSLEQMLLKASGGNPSAMLQAEINRRKKDKMIQRAPSHGPLSSAGANATLSGGPPKMTNWKTFIENIKEHDKALSDAAVRARGPTARPSNTQMPIIKDVYQPTNLVEGRRTDGGIKNVREFQGSKPLGHDLASPQSNTSVTSSDNIVSVDGVPRAGATGEATGLVQLDESTFNLVPTKQRVWIEYADGMAPPQPNISRVHGTACLLDISDDEGHILSAHPPLADENVKVSSSIAVGDGAQDKGAAQDVSRGGLLIDL